ncbi:MAG: hypothetical protein ACRDOI_33195, partial [Trebonia sp.]
MYHPVPPRPGTARGLGLPARQPHPVALPVTGSGKAGIAVAGTVARRGRITAGATGAVLTAVLVLAACSAHARQL